jgi:hypothetical protein
MFHRIAGIALVVTALATPVLAQTAPASGVAACYHRDKAYSPGSTIGNRHVKVCKHGVWVAVPNNLSFAQAKS